MGRVGTCAHLWYKRKVSHSGQSNVQMTFILFDLKPFIYTRSTLHNICTNHLYPRLNESVTNQEAKVVILWRLEVFESYHLFLLQLPLLANTQNIAQIQHVYGGLLIALCAVHVCKHKKNTVDIGTCKNYGKITEEITEHHNGNQKFIPHIEIYTRCSSVLNWIVFRLNQPISQCHHDGPLPLLRIFYAYFRKF